MKHQTLDELQRVAAVHAEETAPRILTRAERLERWADLLEADPDRRLNTLPGTEYEPEEVRRTMRRLHSPLSIASEDPVLRAAGLKDDTYGEAMRFFELSDWQLHGIVCCTNVYSACRKSAPPSVHPSFGVPMNLPSVNSPKRILAY